MQRQEGKKPLGKTGLEIPRIIFGTSCLGNLYQALAHTTKREIVRQWFANGSAPVVLDTAGKYGAGLALEELGTCLTELGIREDQVIISNKLGWKRVPLRTSEPTFEPGVWVGIDHDARQDIGYEGILHCHQQGCDLLEHEYSTQLVSVHDPDEYLAAAEGSAQREKHFRNVLDAYRALDELKQRGEVAGIGIGTKDWTVIRELGEHVDFDWVMLACSLTVYNHPPELLEFIERLRQRNVGIINSAVFHSGFLAGGAYFDYTHVDLESHPELFRWRDRFLSICRQHDVAPAAACVQFGLCVPGVTAVALNTSKPSRVKENVKAVEQSVPDGFWDALQKQGLIFPDLPFLRESASFCEEGAK